MFIFGGDDAVTLAGFAFENCAISNFNQRLEFLSQRPSAPELTVRQ
jgi:hypothetical protein